VVLHGLWIVPLALLIAYLSSPRFRGDIAETRVRRILAAGLDKARYTIFNDLEIPAGGGTIHIDHLVVSKFGVFVVESQYARGWVSGGEFQERWKQSNLRRIKRLDNPLHRNALQADAVGRLLGLPASKIHAMVVLVGQKGFRNAMPDRLQTPEKLIRNVRKKGQQLLSDEQAAALLAVLRGPGVVIGSGAARVRRNRLLLAVLWLLLLGGAFLAFRSPLTAWLDHYTEQARKSVESNRFHPDGRPKTAREIWEDSLVCAYSPDTERCACYEPDGGRADVDPRRCRSLAERGSVLKQ
jgi:hypothetical protein